MQVSFHCTPPKPTMSLTVGKNGKPGNGSGSEVPPSVLKKKRTYTSVIRFPGRKENEKRSSHSVSFNLDTSDD